MNIPQQQCFVVIRDADRLIQCCSPGASALPSTQTTQFVCQGRDPANAGQV